MHKDGQTLRFGLIGTNTITEKWLAGARQDERFILSGITSRDDRTAADFAARHDIPNIFASLEDMASSPLVDAIYIATPNAFHAKQAVLCMDHGKHVICEKPIASNARELATMTEAAKRNKVVLMEAMKPTLSPNFGIVRDTLAHIGKLRRYFGSYCQYSSRYDSFKEGTVLNAFRRELSNGALMDIGVYTIYPMVVLFGKPKGIKAQGSLLSTGVDAQGSVLFDYGDMEASVIYSKVAQSILPTEIQGEKGIITLDKIGQIDKVFLTENGKATQDISSTETLDHFYYEVREFIDTVLDPGKTESAVNSLSNSMIVMEIMDEIRAQVGVHYPADTDI